MKLNWLRAGCASIAECGEYTYVCRQVAPYGFRGTVHYGKLQVDDWMASSIDDCERTAQQWLDQHDKPVWHDATEWLSWAEWRGNQMYARPFTSSSNGWEVYCLGDGRVASVKSLEEAKDAAEKYVREQTK